MVPAQSIFVYYRHDRSDARSRGELSQTTCGILPEGLQARGLLYADDTLLIDTDAETLHQYMNIIVKLGAGYGLQINWKKVELLAVRCAPALKNGLGSILPCKSSIVYLGASVDTSGSIQSELNRRIGLA